MRAPCVIHMLWRYFHTRVGCWNIGGSPAELRRDSVGMALIWGGERPKDPAVMLGDCTEPRGPPMQPAMELLEESFESKRSGGGGGMSGGEKRDVIGGYLLISEALSLLMRKRAALLSSDMEKCHGCVGSTLDGGAPSPYLVMAAAVLVSRSSSW